MLRRAAVIRKCCPVNNNALKREITGEKRPKLRLQSDTEIQSFIECDCDAVPILYEQIDGRIVQHGCVHLLDRHASG